LLTPLSDANDDDDLLPSYEDLLNESRLEIKVGNLIWLKYRTYPWWPSLVSILNFPTFLIGPLCYLYMTK